MLDSARLSKRQIAIALGLLSISCGGSPGGPTLPTPLYDVVAVVFYDENGNGRPDAAEAGRVPDVDVGVEGRIGRTEKLTGRAVIHGVPAGEAEVQIRRRRLPAFYLPGQPLTIQVPQAPGTEAYLPATLPIGSNRPNTYMAFGDSITRGDGSSDGMGYRGLLEADLQGYFGAGAVINQGVEGTRSNAGADRIPRSLAAVRPAYTLIHYGVNDWNDFRCQRSFPCFTQESLAQMVRASKAANSLPFLATIIPGNPAFPQVPPERNNWVHAEDEALRAMAGEEGAVLVDLEAAFLKKGDLTQLFADHIHPNDRGYQIMADEFFKAIKSPNDAIAQGLFEMPSFGFVAPQQDATHAGRRARGVLRPDEPGRRR